MELREKIVYITSIILMGVCFVMKLYLPLMLIFVILLTLYIVDYKYKGKISIRRLILKLLIVIIITMLIYLVLGIGKYRLAGITSSSMHPNLKRGDAIIIKKVKDIDELDKGKIIAYRKEDMLVVHRIIKIDKINEAYIFTTKGDNNKEVDSYTLSLNNIYGEVVFRIPYLGYPSVWFNEVKEHN